MPNREMDEKLERLLDELTMLTRIGRLRWKKLPEYLEAHENPGIIDLLLHADPSFFDKNPNWINDPFVDFSLCAAYNDSVWYILFNEDAQAYSLAAQLTSTDMPVQFPVDEDRFFELVRVAMESLSGILSCEEDK